MRPSIRLLILFILIECQFVYAQPTLNKDFVFGGYLYEELNGLILVADGFVAAGSTRSNQDFGQASDTSWNILIVKYDLGGVVQWQKLYGGSKNDRLWTLRACADGSMIAGGYSYSPASGSKNSPNRGGMDAWVLKLDQNGNIEWEQTYGGTGRDELFSVLEVPTGGFYLACHSASGIGGQKNSPNKGNLDFWLLKIDALGAIEWETSIGGDGEDQLHDIEFAPDGDLLLSGGTVSARSTGDLGPDFARGAKDYWIVKYDPTARQVRWNHRFGGPDDDFAYALCVSQHSNKIYLGGRSASFGAPPTIYNNGKSAPYRGGASDYWLLELNEAGEKQREWSFGGTGLDDLYAMTENEFGQLVLGGVTDSPLSGNKTTPLRGRYDYWLIGLDPDGNQQWQKTIGGSDIDAMTKIAVRPNGSLLVGGHSQSPADFEKTQNSLGVNDFWIVSAECDLQVELTAEVKPCSNEPVLLTPTTNIPCEGCLYRWNTGSSDKTLLLTGDSAVLTIADYRGCIASDTFVLEVPRAPVVELGPSDTLIQQGDILTLGAYQEGYRYRWSNGADSPTLLVSEPGIYSLTITNTAGCTATDAIQIRVEQPKHYYVPNVFSPNRDGPNDYLTIYGNDALVSIAWLRVYDRWGEAIFERNNFEPNQDYLGWDGRFRGLPLESGVYIWAAELLFSDGSKLKIKGDVTIMR